MFSRKKFHERWESGEAKLKANCWRSNQGVTLYATRIVDWTEQGVIRLYTGGYRTVSTKAHMNEVLRALYVDAYVYQEKGVWYVKCGDGHFEFTEGFELRGSK